MNKYNIVANGQTKNIRILDKENIHNNYLQIINQYETYTGTRPNRYDVSALVNGLPLAHIELKAFFEKYWGI
jgi:type I restriction enzyme R subunit